MSQKVTKTILQQVYLIQCGRKHTAPITVLFKLNIYIYKIIFLNSRRRSDILALSMNISGLKLPTKKKKYFHTIFHIFVDLGSLMHFFCILFYVIMRQEERNRRPCYDQFHHFCGRASGGHTRDS